jgi:hypothetical protein
VNSTPPSNETRLHALLEDATVAPPDSDAMARMQLFLAREMVFDVLRWPVVMAVGLAFLALAVRRSSWERGTQALSVAALVAVVAMFLVSRVSRARFVLAVTMCVSAALVLVTSSGDGLLPLLGMKCVVVECVAACVPLGATLFLARRGRALGAPLTLASVAATGALAGQAALHLTCPAHHQLPHLVVFHFVGIALAAGIGWASAPLATAK